MRPPLLERIRAKLCKLIGHREENDGYVVSCRRCRLVLYRASNRKRARDT